MAEKKKETLDNPGQVFLQINIRFILDISGWQSVKISLFNTKISKGINWT